MPIPTNINTPPAHRPAGPTTPAAAHRGQPRGPVPARHVDDPDRQVVRRAHPGRPSAPREQLLAGVQRRRPRGVERKPRYHGSTVSGSPMIVMPDSRIRALLQESLGKPHEARVCNAYLGGSTNYAIDRQFATRQLAKLPELKYSAIQSRKWVARVIEHMARTGIRQVIDFGAGLPINGAPHEILEQYTQDTCHVVSVDHDPVAAAHAHLTLERTGKADAHTVIQADIENHVDLWNAILSTEAINPNEPVGLLMAAVWHFVSDDQNPYQAVQAYRDAVVAGSQLAISHATMEGMTKQLLHAVQSVVADYDSEATSPAFVRPRNEIQRLFGDWTMTPENAGLVWLPEWNSPLATREMQNDTDPKTKALMVCGLAQKP